MVVHGNTSSRNYQSNIYITLPPPRFVLYVDVGSAFCSKKRGALLIHSKQQQKKKQKPRIQNKKNRKTKKQQK